MTLHCATVEQIFEGTEIAQGGTTTCRETGATIRDGGRCIVAVYRHPDSESWTRAGVYVPAAKPPSLTDAVGEPGLHAALIRGRLTVASDQATRKARLVLHAVEVLEDVRAMQPGEGGEGQ